MHSATKRCPLLSKSLIAPPNARRGSLDLRPRTDDRDGAGRGPDDLREFAPEAPLAPPLPGVPIELCSTAFILTWLFAEGRERRMA